MWDAMPELTNISCYILAITCDQQQFIRSLLLLVLRACCRTQHRFGRAWASSQSPCLLIYKGSSSHMLIPLASESLVNLYSLLLGALRPCNLAILGPSSMICNFCIS